MTPAAWGSPPLQSDGQNRKWRTSGQGGYITPAVPFLGRKSAKLRPHKTGPEKQVPAGVDTEDPRVTEQHMSIVMHHH